MDKQHGSRSSGGRGSKQCAMAEANARRRQQKRANCGRVQRRAQRSALSSGSAAHAAWRCEKRSGGSGGRRRPTYAWMARCRPSDARFRRRDGVVKDENRSQMLVNFEMISSSPNLSSYRALVMTS
ncbi:hypothetical protein Scep_007978 [Stephania cephalantha]|uniref:Uncharacterized protein n=1 Tax=Stephania cephalantha TaxID=152367 RepID=A0AAP0KAV7_9MAGN